MQSMRVGDVRRRRTSKESPPSSHQDETPLANRPASQQGVGSSETLSAPRRHHAATVISMSAGDIYATVVMIGAISVVWVGVAWALVNWVIGY
jgi:hypothetical protein